RVNARRARHRTIAGPPNGTRRTQVCLARSTGSRRHKAGGDSREGSMSNTVNERYATGNEKCRPAAGFVSYPGPFPDRETLMRRLAITLAALVVAVPAAVPGDAPPAAVAFRRARILPVAGNPIDDGILVVRDGKIAA